MTATSDSASVAETVTVTAAEYVLDEHAEPLHAIAEVGAFASIWMTFELVVSTLPASSHARYFTVVVVETVNGAV